MGGRNGTVAAKQAPSRSDGRLQTENPGSETLHPNSHPRPDKAYFNLPAHISTETTSHKLPTTNIVKETKPKFLLYRIVKLLLGRKNVNPDCSLWIWLKIHLVGCSEWARKSYESVLLGRKDVGPNTVYKFGRTPPHPAYQNRAR